MCAWPKPVSCHLSLSCDALSPSHSLPSILPSKHALEKASLLPGAPPLHTATPPHHHKFSSRETGDSSMPSNLSSGEKEEKRQDCLCLSSLCIYSCSSPSNMCLFFCHGCAWLALCLCAHSSCLQLFSSLLCACACTAFWPSLFPVHA